MSKSLTQPVHAYETHRPVVIRNIQATADKPYIIEGFEISSNNSNCIEVINSQNVIIRNNYLHDCTWNQEPQQSYSWYSGYAILVKDSENIVIENNRVHNNRIGIVGINTSDLKILNNDIRDTQIIGSLKCELCNNLEIAGNYLIDNGQPEWFWVPGVRMIGIHTMASNNVDIHHNTVIRSSSDGIGVSGHIDGSMRKNQEADWTLVSQNIKIYDNLILDNLELGIWLARATNVAVYNNRIRSHLGISIEFDVNNSQVYHNKILSWFADPIVIGMSSNNQVYENTGYCFDCSLLMPDFRVAIIEDQEVDTTKSQWSGITYSPPSGNKIWGNQVVKIGGDLKDVLASKRKRWTDEHIFEPKGWAACETSEGVIDEVCVEDQELAGIQGMPKDIFIFDPLMENFDDYTQGFTISINQFKAILVIFFILIISLLIWKKWHKNKPAPNYY